MIRWLENKIISSRTSRIIDAMSVHAVSYLKPGHVVVISLSNMSSYDLQILKRKILTVFSNDLLKDKGLILTNHNDDMVVVGGEKDEDYK